MITYHFQVIGVKIKDIEDFQEFLTLSFTEILVNEDKIPSQNVIDDMYHYNRKALEERIQIAVTKIVPRIEVSVDGDVITIVSDTKLCPSKIKGVIGLFYEVRVVRAARRVTIIAELKRHGAASLERFRLIRPEVTFLG